MHFADSIRKENSPRSIVFLQSLIYWLKYFYHRMVVQKISNSKAPQNNISLKKENAKTDLSYSYRLQTVRKKKRIR